MRMNTIDESILVQTRIYRLNPADRTFQYLYQHSPMKNRKEPIAAHQSIAR